MSRMYQASEMHRTIIAVLVSVVGLVFVGCNAKSAIRPRGSTANAKTNQVILPIQTPESKVDSLVLTGLTTVFMADPYGIKRLLPESSVKPLSYEKTGMIGVLSESDKAQLALLVARLPILRGLNDRDTIAVISESNGLSVELFVRTYRVYCTKMNTKPWEIIRVNSFSR